MLFGSVQRRCLQYNEALCRSRVKSRLPAILHLAVQAVQILTRQILCVPKGNGQGHLTGRLYGLVVLGRVVGLHGGEVGPPPGRGCGRAA